jgi:RHS repeat-associated protein
LRYEKDGVLIRRFEFSYDDSGNRASQLDVTPTKAVKWLYFYDWLDRLEVVKRAEAVDVASLPGTIPTVSVYSYDASDNRIEFRVEQEDLTYRYVVDDADNLTEIHLTDGTDPEVLIETLEADADGNMLTRTNELTDEVITYAWDDFDRLIKVSSAISGTPTTTVKEHNRYGVDGIRKRKLDKSGNSSTEYTAGISTVASKAASSGSSAPTISYIMGAGQILGAEVNGNFQFWLADHLGSIREIVDDTGTVIRSQEFGEHGQLLNSSGTGTFAPKTYQGGLSVNDDTADSGLYLMGHRHFEPGLLGRFISRDPIGFRGGLNLFNGSSTNPVTFVDPSGKEVDIRFKDGTWGVANNPQELYDLITNADDGSIVTMNIRGHGRPFACGFDPDDEAAPGLDLVSGKKPRITLDLGKPKPTFLADILRPKLTKHSTIWFSTCYSASGSENIARALSELLPGTYVQGNDGSLNSLFGMDLYVAKGKDVAGTSGKVKVYLGGAEVPLTDVIREPYGIHDKASRQ